jgi:broad specificity phosphatase PhoE
LSIIKGVPTVLLVRHGQASFGAEDYDVLSPTGRRQAEVLATALDRREIVPSRLLAGSMRRQRETAEAFAPGAEVVVDPRWDEYDANEVLTHHAETALRLDGHGEAEQGEVTSRAFQAALEPALRGWIEAGQASPSAHTWPLFSAAGAAALEQLAAELGRGETALVFTSGGTIAAICAALLEAPAAFIALNRVLVNTGVSKLVIGAAGTSLISVNDHSHLEGVDRALVTYR